MSKKFLCSEQETLFVKSNKLHYWKAQQYSDVQVIPLQLSSSIFIENIVHFTISEL